MNLVQKWLIVAGGFISYFLADGFTYSVGIFYNHFLQTFNLNSSFTAILPGLLYAVPQFTAILLCPLLETYGYSSGAGWGAVILSASCIGSTFAPNMHVLYFTFGLLASFGLQLTYSSAIMAVTDCFKDNRLFGLALGLTMCGSGFGSIAFNPFVAWMLERWTWREVLLIEGAILLNSLISASCFHHLDATRFPISLKSGEQSVDGQVELHRTTELLQCLDEISDEVVYARRPHWLCIRYLLCVPSRYRFSSLSPTASVQAIKTQKQNACAGLGKAFKVSLKQLIAPELWRNPSYIAYILANAIAGAGTVIPWTFIYDHGIYSLAGEHGKLDEANSAALSWLPSLIGFGSLIGQVGFGLLTSQFGRLGTCHCLLNNSADHSRRPDNSMELDGEANLCCCRIWSSKSRRRLLLFTFVLLWNGFSTLLLALLPIYRLADQISPQVSFLSIPLGQAMAAACLFVGISYGGYYVIYPQMLVDILGDELWPAGLGVFLFVNGTMNLIGTTIGGYIFDAFRSYKPAFLLASVIPFVSFLIIAAQQAFNIRSKASGSL